MHGTIRVVLAWSACWGWAAACAAGVFIPQNGGYEGRIGEARVFLDSAAGGVLRVVDGEWPRLETKAVVDMAFAVRKAGEERPVAVEQGFDRSPEIIFLEEGDLRLGVRVRFLLYDRAGVYHGHGMTETWVYPDGRIFVTAAAGFEDRLAHEDVSQAAVRVRPGRPLAAVRPGGGEAAEGVLALDAFRVAPTDEALPARSLELVDEAGASLGLSWLAWKMTHNTVIPRKQGDAPTYYRWPAYLPQAYWGSGPVRELAVGDGALELRWLAEKPAGRHDPMFVALFRLTALGAGSAAALADAERAPLPLEVTGGVIHGAREGYNDQEGCYEVRKTNNPVRIVLPADPLARRATVKVIGLTGHGAVTAALDGRPVVPQLATEGGIADDPLAPIREGPEGPADAALVTVQLGAEPRELTLAEEPGVQFVYQSRDRWRQVACFSSRGGPRYAGFKFSLVDGRIRNMRQYGRPDWALTENLMTWFSFCGYTPLQIADRLEDFAILENGPARAAFRYVSLNANGRARSTYSVAVPADAPGMQINVKARFEVLEDWPYRGSQFFDVFPFRGVWPQEWWYDEVLWLAPDGRAKWMRTKEWTYGGDTALKEIAGPGFFAFYSADRGNMVMLTKNFSPELPVEYVICGNYIDFHMQVVFRGEDGKAGPPAPGTTVEMEYDLALWGDGRVTREQVMELGQRSLKAGKLAIP